MSAYDIAKKFFDTREAPAGWEGCKEFVADGATFTVQSESLTDVTTVEAYCEWVKQIGTVIAPDATYDLHTSSYDDSNRTAVFCATLHAKHTGDGG